MCDIVYQITLHIANGNTNTCWWIQLKIWLINASDPKSDKYQMKSWTFCHHHWLLSLSVSGSGIKLGSRRYSMTSSRPCRVWINRVEAIPWIIRRYSPNRSVGPPPVHTRRQTKNIMNILTIIHVPLYQNIWEISIDINSNTEYSIAFIISLFSLNLLLMIPTAEIILYNMISHLWNPIRWPYHYQH